MYFVANKAQPGSTFTTAFGPFETREAAVSTMEKILVPGDYVVYGPAQPVHSIKIASPSVESVAL